MERHTLGTGWDEDLTDEDLDIRLARLKDRASRSTPIEDAHDLEEAIEQAADRIASRRAAGERDSSPAAVIRYQVSSPQASGPGKRSIKVVFTADQACAGVRVRMVAVHGETMPTSARPSDVVPILEATLTLQAGVPADFNVSVPQSVKRPFWVRCFVVDDQTTWRVDPAITSLKEA